jgi:hypothetical protein
MITEQEWNSIAQFVTKIAMETSGRRGDHFFVDKVIKRDEVNSLIWVKELVDTPIPLFGFDYLVKYIDETPAGTGWGWGDYIAKTQTIIVKPLTPNIGDLVLIAREMGSGRMPRCLGVLHSKNFATDEPEVDSTYDPPSGF